MFKRKKSATKRKFRDVNPEDAHYLIQENEDNSDFIILDVRTPAEFQESHLERAKLLDFYRNDFKEELLEMDRSKKYLIYCRTGVRSSETLNMMLNADFQEAYNLLGGINQWIREGLPLNRP